MNSKNDRNNNNKKNSKNNNKTSYELSNKMHIKKYKLSRYTDERGSLVAVESFRDIPFEIKRIYYLYDTNEGFSRGNHAHKNLEQILIALHGSCKVRLDDGKNTEEVILDRPDEGLYISSLIWRELYEFSSDAILMVLASEYYDDSDYIRDYNIFLKLVEEKTK